MTNRRKNFQILGLLIAVLILNISCSKPELKLQSQVISLNTNWKMQPADKLQGIDEATVSQNMYDASGWYGAIVPGTVMGALSENKVIEDPTFGVNMKNVDPAQFKQPWWFRTSFNLSADDVKKKVSLRFNGINYRADLWVNGKKVESMEKFAGAYRMFTFNISDYVTEGENSVALKMVQRADGEYSIGFVDWNPLPADRSMGIFREVFVEINKGIKIRSPFIYSKVDTVSKTAADLFMQAELENNTDQPVEGILRANFEIGQVEKKIKLGAHETVSVKFTPADFPSLSVKNVELWWPNGMGNPKLYNLSTQFISGSEILDEVKNRYGIREIVCYMNEDKNRSFKINGKFVLPKGGGWADDIFLRDTRKSVEAQMRYIRHMGLNSIRCEGFWGKDDNLFDLCDEYGILNMIGWSCEWEWQEYLLKPTNERYGGAVTPEDIQLLADYWKDQMLWLRNHPSIYVWMLGSDQLPHPDLEKKYIALFEKYDPSRAYITSAGGAGTDKEQVIGEGPIYSEISGPTGMKMLGPYAWTPPHYWFTDTKLGGAWGFNTETCPGASIAPVASLKKMMPEKAIWPIDRTYWEYHTGRNQFTSLDRDIIAIEKRYGKSDNIEDFDLKAQANNYEIMRPMFEAFIAHKPKSTGLVQWQLNSAWPKLIWQLYDTYLQPNGSFYGTKKACTPLHAIYRYGFDDIYLANEDLQDAKNLTVGIRVFDINSKEIFVDKWTGDIASNISKFIYKLPEIKNLTPVYFLDLRIYNSENKEIDNNFYWLSTKKDELDYEAAKKLEWAFYTPAKAFADYTALNKLPKVKPEIDYTYSKEGEFGKVVVTMKNNSETIAFFNFMDLVDPVSNQPVLPVFWSDNYVTLLPNETRTYEAKFFLTDFAGDKPAVAIRGLNVEKKTLLLASALN